MLRTSDNRILLTSSGNLLRTYELPKIEVTNRGTVFPDGYSSSTTVIFNTTVVNTIYIDFGDGSAIYEREFSGALQLRRDSPIHTYSVSGDYHVKIWFKFPSKVNRNEFDFCHFYGDFPIAISLYSLDSLRLNNCYFNDFPINYGAVVMRTLYIGNPSSSTINNIPLWITRSRINRLDYGGGRINLSNQSINNVDKLINIQGLSSLNFLNDCRLSDIPSNIKNITLLKYLSFSGNTPISSITPNINACKQITHLGFGYISNANFGSPLIANGQINSWGEGISNMPNLQYLGITGCANVPTDSIIGLNTATSLKTIYARSSYNTIARMDAFLTNLYNSVIAIASMVNANTIMRQVRLEVCWISSNGPTVRPSGTYQAPTGYIQGSNNGTPSSPMEMLYVLVKQYRWTVLVQNTTNNGIETLTP